MKRPDQRDETNKTTVQEYWNSRAKAYDGDGISGIHSEEQREAWQSLLREWTGNDPRRVLDLGCGTGVISLLLAELGHEVTGVDISPEMIEQARAKTEKADISLEFRTGDAEELPYDDDTFDLLTTRWLLWTLPNPEKALQEWQRVVRPNGKIIIIEGHWNFPEPWEEYQDVHDELPLFHGRAPEELTGFIADQGLNQVEDELLMDSVLWGQEPEQKIYALTGKVTR